MPYYCGECRQECQVYEEDVGIGSYEYWGAKGCDTHYVLSSKCCDAEVFTDSECTQEADIGDFHASKLDEQADTMYDSWKEKTSDE